ncbi:phosphogluconate dehydratase [Celerinatantimonas sp. MCCC 1A17872]|uniref:phosphogluconate dehydratase n=1 Tax=Celerinatantimonas sp. MCCC 1A17872 TaxID=3177514 RepID=UPI0038C03AD6
MMNPTIEAVTQRIAKRSYNLRQAYLDRLDAAAKEGPKRSQISCGNLAHTVAACSSGQKSNILDFTRLNMAIVTAYNDMLSAHQPYQYYPDELKKTLRDLGHSAQVAGGVAAMCDGVTQGQDGMELSLFSRDNIAQSTAIALSHQTFDGTLLLGICDKIAPGQLMGALSFSHLPTMFVPAGPMTTGISNEEKVAVRQRYAAGQTDKSALQEMECQAYHSPGTCTFYGTANTNQLVFEAMGLMLPGSAFVYPDSQLRHELTAFSARQMAKISRNGDYRPIGRVVDEKSLVNGLVALLASGGSTNHTIHMVALARAAGLILTWDDIAELSETVPLVARIYPNGPADINQFHAAGGVPLLLKTLNELEMLHTDVLTCYGTLADYFKVPAIVNEQLVWQDVAESKNLEIIARAQEPFSKHGGLALLAGNLGRGVMKISAVDPIHRKICAPARVFDSQNDVEAAYKRDEFQQDCVIVVRYNGPSANGMPELHKLMPILGNLMKQGLQVALVTDGRLSGASGKVPSVLHVTPEAQRGGPLSQLKDGDIIDIDAETGSMICHSELADRPLPGPQQWQQQGCGRELFAAFRHCVTSAEQGATILFNPEF